MDCKSVVGSFIDASVRRRWTFDGWIRGIFIFNPKLIIPRRIPVRNGNVAHVGSEFRARGESGRWNPLFNVAMLVLTGSLVRRSGID